MKLLSKSWTIPFKSANDIRNTENGSSGAFRADILDADAAIKDLCTILSNEGWEIKSVIPLISGIVFGTALLNSQGLGVGLKSYGGGYGYGASFTEGVIVLAQKLVNESYDELKNDHLKVDNIVLNNSGSTFDYHASSPDDDSSVLDLTGFTNNMEIHHQLKHKCPICDNNLIIDNSDPKDIYQWCPDCQKKFQ